MPLIIDEQNDQIDNGIWREFEGSEFLIASSASIKFMRTMARLQKPFRRQLEKNELDPAEQQKMLIQALSQSILLDWKGVQNKAGEDVKYTTTDGAKALKNPAFREFVMEVSSDLANFKAEEKELEENS
jgi:hypothetical protein